jgi:hypothetical protein
MKGLAIPSACRSIAQLPKQILQFHSSQYRAMAFEKLTLPHISYFVHRGLYFRYSLVQLDPELSGVVSGTSTPLNCLTSIGLEEEIRCTVSALRKNA